MSGKTDFTKNEDVVRQILEQLDASVDSFATLLRLRVTCAAAKSIIDAMLQPEQEGIAQWLGMLRARTSAVTHSTVLLDLAGGAGTKEDPPIHWNLWYISRAEVFRMLQENYFVDSRFVRIIFCHMRTKVDHIIVAVHTAITHTFYEAICLFGDVCTRAMRSGFAKSVDALASAFRVHQGRTALKAATNAVRLLLQGRSAGCPEVHQKVKQMVHARGLMQPAKHRKKR